MSSIRVKATRRRAASPGTSAGPCGRCSSGRLNGAKQLAVQVVGVMLAPQRGRVRRAGAAQRRRLLRPLPRRRPHVDRRDVGHRPPRSRVSFDHVDAVRVRHAARLPRPRSPAMPAPTRGSSASDGDELYDPARLDGAFARSSTAGALPRATSASSRTCSTVTELDRDAAGRRPGISRRPRGPVTKLFNFAAIDSLDEVLPPVRARRRARCSAPGYDWEAHRTGSASARRGRRARCAACTRASSAARAWTGPADGSARLTRRARSSSAGSDGRLAGAVRRDAARTGGRPRRGRTSVPPRAELVTKDAAPFLVPEA